MRYVYCFIYLFINSLSVSLCLSLSISVSVSLSQALHYLVLISVVEEKEIFKICLEYWNHFAAGLYLENPFSTTHSPISLSQTATPSLRRQLFFPILSKVCPLVTTPPFKTFGRGLDKTGDDQSNGKARGSNCSGK